MEEAADPFSLYRVDIDGTGYYCVRGSDVDRDGMYLEVSRPYGNAILEIFHSDKTGHMTLTAFQSDVPLSVVEWLVALAKRSLPLQSKSNTATPARGGG